MSCPDDKDQNDDLPAVPPARQEPEAAVARSKSKGGGERGAKPRTKIQAEKNRAKSAEEAKSVKTDKASICFQTGLFPLEHFAIRMDLTERQVRNLRAQGFFSARHIEAAAPMLNAEVLPIDFPRYGIGPVPNDGIKALMKGDAEVAEALSAKLMRADERTWLSGKINDRGLSELQKFYARLVNGIAWSHNKHCWEVCEAGLPALHRLHQDVTARMQRGHNQASLEWRAWQYLFVTTASYDLAYAVAVNALRLFSRDPAYPNDPDALSDKQRSERKEKSRAALDAHRSWVASLEYEGRDFENFLNAEKVMAIRYWWNRSQLAAVADDDEEFILCIDKLQENREGERSELIKIMSDDHDTVIMVEKLKM
jgi:hypothetical protein